MGYDQVLGFAMFATVAAITPGPSNVVLAATGALVGVTRGLPCLLGVGVGMASMMFLAAMGLGAAVLGSPVAFVAVKWCGIAFLLWLAWRIATAPAREAGDAASQARPTGFVGALALQWVNPKSWLVSTSAASAYLRPGGELLPQAASIAGLFLLVALPCGAMWLGFGTAMRRLLRSASRQRAFNACMGTLLALSAALFV